MDTQIFQENIQENIQENTINNSMEEQLLQNNIELPHTLKFNENNSNIEQTLPSDCLICLEIIGPSQSSWDCPQCHQIFHSTCKEDWNIRLPEPFFTCPHCKFKVLNTISESSATGESETTDMIQHMADVIDTRRRRRLGLVRYYCRRCTSAGRQFACVCCSVITGLIVFFLFILCFIDYDFFSYAYGHYSNYTGLL